MGKKFGKRMKAVAAAVAALSQPEIAELERAGSITLMAEGEAALIEREDVEIVSRDIPGWTVANEGSLTVALDMEITPELRREGWAREMVKRIQTLRKESNFEITDRIAVCMERNEPVETTLGEFGEYIKAQVLAESITLTDEPLEGAEELLMGDLHVRFTIRQCK